MACDYLKRNVSRCWNLCRPMIWIGMALRVTFPYFFIHEMKILTFSKKNESDRFRAGNSYMRKQTWIAVKTVGIIWTGNKNSYLNLKNTDN